MLQTIELPATQQRREAILCKIPLPCITKLRLAIADKFSHSNSSHMKSLFIVFIISSVYFNSNVSGQTVSDNMPVEQPTPPRVTHQRANGSLTKLPKGPYQPSWESIRQHYKVPEWFVDGKFGIFIHYGVYTVAAYASEWYPRHMYSNGGVRKWHEERFGGSVDQVGYKDLIPHFKMERFNASEWADLFKKVAPDM
ncbi:alpha-L-fucosidase [Niabella hibiscisoli]|nr:alpha-L-fucosidase [Niabella hibiscisoli]MCH5717950.1 alpha-L-fucosidase [Niabella hibiscisoli]